MKTFKIFQSMAILGIMALTSNTYSQDQLASLHRTENKAAINSKSYAPEKIKHAAFISSGKNEDKMVVNFYQNRGERTTIKMYQYPNNELLYRNYSSKLNGAYNVTIDISQLESGEYKIVVKNGSDEVVKKFEIKYNSERRIANL